MPARTRSLSWFKKLSDAVTAAATRLGARFEFVDVESTAELEMALTRLVREGIGAVSMDFAQEFHADAGRIAAALIAHRLPSIGPTDEGFLLEYQPSLLPLARKAAEYVDKILRGAKPANLPVEQASAFELRINLKTARAIGLAISPSLRMRATELIR
jgi:putative ABC transport system substrate-binding protein